MRRLIVASALLLTLVPGLRVAEAQRLDGIAAVVNEDVVLQSDVEEQLAAFLMRNQAAPDSAMVDTLRLQILQQLIDEKLIVAEAKRQGITVPDAEVEKQIDQAIGEARERLGGEEAFKRQLQQENLTEAKLREKYRTDLRRQLLAQRLVMKQLPKKNVTPTEAEAYFKAHRAKFPRVPPEVKVQVIQIPATPDSVTDQKARARVAAARKRIVDGEKFAKVAGDVSEDPGTARSGGDLGYFGRGELDPVVEAAAFQLKLGELSQPLRSPFGWHLIEVMDRDTMKTRAKKDSLDSQGKPVLEMHARHILVRVPVTEADAERAKKLADRVHGEAMKGADFGSLVRRYSKYPGQQGEDGDLGFISLGTLPASIRAGLDTVGVGRVSPVLINPAGFNIFKVNDKKPEREYQLEEIREELPEVVAQMIQRDKYDEWMKSLRSKAHIEIKNS